MSPHIRHNEHLMLLTETITIYPEKQAMSIYTLFGRNFELEQGIYVAT
jgi:hypothetical protein